MVDIFCNVLLQISLSSNRFQLRELFQYTIIEQNYTNRAVFCYTVIIIFSSFFFFYCSTAISLNVMTIFRIFETRGLLEESFKFAVSFKKIREKLMVANKVSFTEAWYANWRKNDGCSD